MKKKGGILLFVGILIAVIILIIGAGIYLYNFHVFKTLRVCLTKGTSTEIPCENASLCRDFAITIMPDIDMSDAPEFLKNSFDKTLEEVIYCDKTCFIRDIRGVSPDTQEFELLENCEEGEIEIAMDIRGKEAIETLIFLRNRKNRQ